MTPARQPAISGAFLAITPVVVGVVLNLDLVRAACAVRYRRRNCFLDLTFDVAILASADWAAIGMTASAVLAIFRPGVDGVALAGCGLAGIASSRSRERVPIAASGMSALESMSTNPSPACRPRSRQSGNDCSCLFPPESRQTAIHSVTNIAVT